MAWDVLGVGPSFIGQSKQWGQFGSGSNFKVRARDVSGAELAWDQVGGGAEVALGRVVHGMVLWPDGI